MPDGLYVYGGNKSSNPRHCFHEPVFLKFKDGFPQGDTACYELGYEVSFTKRLAGSLVQIDYSVTKFLVNIILLPASNSTSEIS
jgi:hypothetical protein